ncbi:MAG: hydrogenase maturation protease [Giesbergeria sp.]|nr:hydrogenase maturation protease [Giesbergeria sp.]
MNAPLLIFAVGNPSRGDDALGPLLLDRLQADGLDAGGQVELLCDFQFQVEHMLDLQDRSAVLLIDAARPGVVRGALITALQPRSERLTPASHALDGRTLLGLALRMHGTAPPAWMLAIEGASFDLGEDLSPLAQQHLEQAHHLALTWVDERLARAE